MLGRSIGHVANRGITLKRGEIPARVFPDDEEAGVLLVFIAATAVAPAVVFSAAGTLQPRTVVPTVAALLTPPGRISFPPPRPSRDYRQYHCPDHGLYRDCYSCQSRNAECHRNVSARTIITRQTGPKGRNTTRKEQQQNHSCAFASLVLWV